MTRLVLVGDCAYPLPVDKYPASMVAVCGYLGGDTPHIWTDTEIATLRASGRQFWPIWTAPNSKTGTAINAATGFADGAGMISALRAQGIPTSVPVFYDVESSTYNANPAGATDAIAHFKGLLQQAGWRAFAYCTKAYNRDWVAWWNNIRPTSLPDGWVGQQYSGVPGLDYSIFDLDRLGVDDMQLSDDDIARVAEATRASVAGWMQKYVVAQFGGSIDRLVKVLGIATAEQADIGAIKAALLTGVGTAGPVDYHALAAELERLVGQALTDAASGSAAASTGS